MQSLFILTAIDFFGMVRMELVPKSTNKGLGKVCNTLDKSIASEYILRQFGI
jgi:hypothetical protein